jgi:heat shock protein HslJ
MPLLRPRLVLLVAVMILTACGGGATASPDPSHPDLGGTTWRAVSVAGRPAPAANGPTIAFTGDQASGNAGCNHFGGGYRYDRVSGRLTFAQLGMTAMACLEQDRMVLETTFIQILGAATTAAVDEQGRLGISAPTGLIVFVRDVGPGASAS